MPDIRRWMLLAVVGAAMARPCASWADPAAEADAAAASAPAAEPAEDCSGEDGGAPAPGLFRGGALTFQHENDAFVPKLRGIVGTDRYYTAGQRIAWVSRCGPNHWFLKPLVAIGKKDATTQRWGLELGQNIFTPQNIHTATPDPLDRPYAGWLYLGATLVSHNAREQNLIEVQLGVVGPSALGEEAQNGIHRIRNLQQALGWAHQLKDEPALLVTREDRLAPLQLAFTDNPKGWAVDFTPMSSLQFGNVQTSAAVGGGLRLGYDLPDDFGPPRMRPGPSGVSYFDGKGAGGYLFLSGDVRVVAHDIFLDGNTFRDSPSVHKVPLGWEFETGYVVRAWGARFTYAFVRRSREFRHQQTPDEFASISVTLIPRDFPLQIR